jgi:hypothetical protein
MLAVSSSHNFLYRYSQSSLHIIIINLYNILQCRVLIDTVDSLSLLALRFMMLSLVKTSL